MIDDNIETVSLDASYGVEGSGALKSFYEAVSAFTVKTMPSTEIDTAMGIGRSIYRVGDHMFYGPEIVPDNSYEESVLAAYSTPGLKKCQLTRSTKKLAMGFDENYRGWTKQQVDEFLDKLFPEEVA